MLSFSVPPETKREFKELAEEQSIGASELFREMLQVYEDYREEKELQRLQRYGAIRAGQVRERGGVVRCSLLGQVVVLRRPIRSYQTTSTE